MMPGIREAGLGPGACRLLVLLGCLLLGSGQVERSVTIESLISPAPPSAGALPPPPPSSSLKAASTPPSPIYASLLAAPPNANLSEMPPPPPFSPSPPYSSYPPVPPSTAAQSYVAVSPAVSPANQSLDSGGAPTATSFSQGPAQSPPAAPTPLEATTAQVPGQAPTPILSIPIASLVPGEGSPGQAPGSVSDAANPTFSSLPVGYDPSTYATQNYILNIIGQDLIPFTYSKKVACLDAVDDRIQAYPHSSVLAEIANVTSPAAPGSSEAAQAPLSAGRKLLAPQQTDQVAVNITITADSGAMRNITTILAGAITDGAIQQALQQNGLSVTNVQNITVNVITAPGAPAPGPVLGHPPSHSSGVTSGAIAGITAGAAVAVLIAALLAYRWHMQRHTPEGAMKLPDMGNDGKAASDTSEAPDMMQQFRQKVFGARERGGQAPAQVVADSSQRRLQAVHSGRILHTGEEQEPLEGRPSLQDTPMKRAASMEPSGTPSSATSVGPPGHHFTGRLPLERYDSAADSNLHTLAEDKAGPAERPATPSDREGTSPGGLQGLGGSSHSLAASSSNALNALAAGREAFDPWKVVHGELVYQRMIGEGSFGTVWLAKWRETLVAVKKLSEPSQLAESDEDRSQWRRMLQAMEKEANMMAKMRHPNTVLYLGFCPSPPVVVTEFCSRGSLLECLRQGRQKPALMDWPRRLNMALDAAKGMLYLHTSSPPVIHRDLKSPNLLVDKHWRVKVCDFNLSRVVEETVGAMTSLSATNPKWLAPEVLSGRPCTTASDVYAFGIILWEMLTWRLPWHDCGTWQVVAMVTDGQERPEIPEAAELPGGTLTRHEDYLHLMRRCWAQEAAQRPNFGEICPALRKMLEQEVEHRRRCPPAHSPVAAVPAGVIRSIDAPEVG